VPNLNRKVDASVGWKCDKCPYRHAPGSSCPPSTPWRAGVTWLINVMPDGQWPVDQSLPRDDSWSWWVRSHCGHKGGARQWAFYEKRWATIYEQVFRENPCRYTRCNDQKRGDA